MASILAFESFDGGSHKQFRETITKRSSHEWSWITRPPRSWKWRMAVSALEMVDEAKQQGISKPDILFCTSLTDVAALRSALPPNWRGIPLVLYMHENQVAYPTKDARDASFAFTNLQSVLTADLTIFNSKWNLDSFISGIERLFEKSWDKTIDNIGERIRANSTVAWVPVEHPPDELVESRVLHNSDNEGRSRPVKIVWPHRWEHDKGPEQLLTLARKHTQALNLRWIILGEQFKEVPPALTQFSSEFKDNIEHIGHVESKGEYWKWLHKADWVLSTAKHEFYGIAVVEALFAGCLPWLPDELSYKELLPACARGLTPATHAKKIPSAEILNQIKNHLTMAQAEPATKRIDSIISSLL